MHGRSASGAPPVGRYEPARWAYVSNMSSTLTAFAAGKRILVVVAAPAEAKAVWAGVWHDGIAWEGGEWRVLASPGVVDVVASGVGKANAAGATARFAWSGRYAGVISLGIAGALPGSGLKIGEVVLASACAYADEGVLTETGFQDIGALGFPPITAMRGMAIPTDEGLNAALRGLGVVDREGVIATVSTCSGTDDLARATAERTGAIAEAMEGAAAAQMGVRAGVAAAELRVISNTTGDRGRQVWDLKGALERLRGVAERLG